MEQTFVKDILPYAKDK